MTGFADKLGYVAAIRAAAARAPESVASVFEGRRYNWRETINRAACIAGGLRTLGINPGDRIAVLGQNSDRILELFVAVPWCGAVIVPLNPRWSPRETLLAILDCQPRAIFVGDGVAEDVLLAVASLAAQVVPVCMAETPTGFEWKRYEDLLLARPAEDRGRKGDDLLAIFYTGGTTGDAKGVMISHAGLLGNCRAIALAGMFPSGCRSLIVAPLFHIAAAAAMTATLLAGGTAVVQGSFRPDRLLEALARESITDVLLVPTMIQMLLADPAFAAEALGGLKRLIYGASPIGEATLDQLMTAAPHVDFYQAYGMTELSCAAAILGPEFHRGEHRTAGRHRAAGVAVSDTELLIADVDGHPVAMGEIGEVLVRGPGVMTGYWNRSELTDQALRGGWMHTGDGGRLDEFRLLYIVDRLKDMIVSGGENVYSGEVESAIAQHPGVLQCAVIGIPSDRWGEAVHAVILPRSGCDLTSDDIVEHCRSLIAGYKIPRSVEFTQDPLPISAAGKILKQSLRNRYWQGQGRNVA